MNKGLVALVAIMGGTLVAGGAWISTMRRDVRELRDRVAKLETRQEAAPARADLERIETQVERVETDVAQVKSDVALRPAAPAPAPGAPGASAPALSPEEIQALVDQRVEAKVKEQGDGGFGGKKRPLADVAKDIGVDAAAQKQMAMVSDEAKQEVFDLFLTPRTDGSNLADDVIEAMTSGDKDRAQQQFMRIFKEKIPGTDETYFAAAIRVSEAAMQRMANVLTPDQLTAYKHTGVGPLDLETGYDPWAEYLKSKQ